LYYDCKVFIFILERRLNEEDKGETECSIKRAKANKKLVYSQSDEDEPVGGGNADVVCKISNEDGSQLLDSDPELETGSFSNDFDTIF
jgi:hypothetical protein